ncbi:hypothetical protein [Deinococcus sp. Leaf326]|uniref:hypothetical protein n=1 Tax=Deinococcus sp. Leaf326 TaxID=1736338 RepID=UPI000B15FE91|nr:hypothetical protein [Deinococcus sp. Leaf326]
MTRVTATVDDQGRLMLPEAFARTLQAGQQLTIEVDPPPLDLDAAHPLYAFIGTLPRLESDSRTHYRRERGHEE